MATGALPSGEPLLEHALDTAGMLGELRLDHEALAAALLFRCSAVAPASVGKLRESFGKSIADLVDGVARMGAIGALSGLPQERLRPEEQAAQLEALRKMLLAMVQDVRVVLIKLADHLQTLRYAVRRGRHGGARGGRALTLDIYAPLANRLGVWQLKWELEDLAFRFLEPETYQRIARAAGREARRPRALTSRASIALLEGRADARRHRGRGHRPAQAHLQHLQEDAAQGLRLRGSVRRARACACSSTT